jgi:hypothetical protein
MSLLRGGLIDFAVYGRSIISVPRFALMAVSNSTLAFLARNPGTPAINFTFNVSAMRTENKDGQAKLVLRRERMSDPQIEIHEAALIAVAHWLTKLCTPMPIALVGASFPIETCIRFICTVVLDMPEYVHHLTAKFIMQASKLALSSYQIAELVKSCRAEDDELLVGLAGKLVEKKLDGQIAPQQLKNFLDADGTGLLRKRVHKLVKEMDFGNMDVPIEKKVDVKKENDRVYEVTDGHVMDIDTEMIEVDAAGWQLFPRARDGSTPRKKRKVEVIVLD